VALLQLLFYAGLSKVLEVFMMFVVWPHGAGPSSLSPGRNRPF
jgi:hypothetical protein